MTPPKSNPRPGDLLDRAEAALRSAPAPDGPSEALLARTLAALRAAGRSERPPTPNPNRRRRPMLAIAKLSAAAALALAAAAYLVLNPAPEAAAFAEAAEALRQARSLAYRQTIDAGDGAPPVVQRVLWLEPGLSRVEADGRPLAIADAPAGRSMFLDHDRKTAVVVEGKAARPEGRPAGPKDEATALVDLLRNFGDREPERVGRRAVDGVEADGYRATDRGQEFVAWVDPAAKRVVRIEHTAEFDGRKTRMVASDFEVDPPLDPALFRVEVPEGYARREMPALPGLDEALAHILRLYAEAGEGDFPPRLDDWMAYARRLEGRRDRPTSPADPELVRDVQAIVQVQMFLLRGGKGKYGYRPEGVTLGDADKVLFWYRPEGAENYRAIFGDLRAGDVAADRLPERPDF